MGLEKFKMRLAHLDRLGGGEDECRAPSAAEDLAEGGQRSVVQLEGRLSLRGSGPAVGRIRRYRVDRSRDPREFARVRDREFRMCLEDPEGPAGATDHRELEVGPDPAHAEAGDLEEHPSSTAEGIEDRGPRWRA